jgi:hypothetical protein
LGYVWMVLVFAGGHHRDDVRVLNGLNDPNLS